LNFSTLNLSTFNFSTFQLLNLLNSSTLSTIGKEINIASNFEISMDNTLNLIKEIMQSDVQFITDEQRLRPKDSELFRLLGDISLMNNLTGWQPEYDIEVGMKETVKWFLKDEHLKRYKTWIFNI